MRGGKRAELLSSWKKLRDLDEMMGETVLELLAHPDAQPEHIAEVRAKWIKHREMMWKGWQQIEHAFRDAALRPSPPHFIQMRRARRARELADKVSASVVHRIE